MSKEKKGKNLRELSSQAAEDFLEYLEQYCSDHLSSVMPVFNLRAPTCLYDMTGLEAKNIIAFGIGGRTRGGITNTTPITIQQARNELIAEAISEIDGNKTDEEKEKIAKAQLWPTSEKGIREKDRGIYNRDADALIAHAENRMAADVKSLLNSDETYQKAKAQRCLVGFIETIRAKSAIGINNAQANRQALENQLRNLKMAPKLDAYLDYKQKFLKIINNLRKVIDSEDWNEEKFVAKFLCHLDQTLFHNVYYNRIGPEESYIKGPKTIETIMKATDVIYDAVKTTQMMTGSTSDHKSDKEEDTVTPEANSFFTTTDNESGNKRKANKMSQDSRKDKGEDNHEKKPKTSPSPTICKFWKPDKKSSCRFGDKCNNVHLAAKELTEWKDMQDKMNKILNNRKT